ncbi:helix-turn-helix domain-containing protein [Pannonibacter sp. SL95]|nr:helix-turn-helix domain-containing protein [Pannonibacter sp. SL95]MCY1705204.1 helix-turn-helix domain-containing protein [Pannonibacter sp. SL95]
MAALAKLAGSTPAIFGHVWTRPVRKAEQAIADFLKVPVADLFPDRYPIRSSRILSRANEQLLNGNDTKAQAARDAA